ncbi:MAG: hypothetical protein V3V92_05070 [Candidatus Hydrothermarchaeales archaeon]
MPLDVMQNEVVSKPLRLILLFTLLGLMFWYFPKTYAYVIWWVLVVCALGWLVIELRDRKDKNVRKAVEIGTFLMLFDFLVENAGKLVGLWESHNSAYFLLAVPIEVMLLALMGGTAWALYQPKRFNRSYTLVDVAIFATFGALGEYIIGTKGLIIYMGGWTSFHAFLGYALTWTILHSIVYLRMQSTAPRPTSSV